MHRMRADPPPCRRAVQNSHHIDIHNWMAGGRARPERVVAMAATGVAEAKLGACEEGWEEGWKGGADAACAVHACC